MPTMGTIDIQMSGPLIEGRAPAEIEELQAEILRTLSAAGVGLVRANSKDSFKHPTPYYWTQVDATVEAPGVAVVDDGGVIYGPWLEGISHRNQTTRFKGYAMFRRSVQELQDRAEALVADAVKRTTERLGGGES